MSRILTEQERWDAVNARRLNTSAYESIAIAQRDLSDRENSEAIQNIFDEIDKGVSASEINTSTPFWHWYRKFKELKLNGLL